MTNNLKYFLCSEDVIKHHPIYKHSKPFKSGYVNDEYVYYVALLDYVECKEFFENLILCNGGDAFHNYWVRECIEGNIDVSKITISSLKENGVFKDIEYKVGLTTEKNIAMVIYNLAEKYNITPIQLINRTLRK